MSQFTRAKTDATTTLATLAAFGSLTFPALGAPVVSLHSETPLSAVSQQPPLSQISDAAEKARVFAFQNTHEPISDLGKFAASELQRFGRAIGVPQEQLDTPKVAFHGAFVKAVTNNWIYQFNAGGEQTIRPVSNVPLMISELTRNSQSSSLDNSEDRLIIAAKKLASVLGFGDDTIFKTTLKKQEILFVVECKNLGQSSQWCNGRFMVRLKADGNQYFQVLFDDNKVVRVDTNFQTASAKNAGSLLFHQIQSGPNASLVKGLDGNITFGTFFDPSEYRFEESAETFEGIPYLDPKATTNPFEHDNFDAAPFLSVHGHFDASSRTDLVDYRAWANTGDGKYWQFYQFSENGGREGGVRGTFDSKTQAWSVPNITVAHHPLKNYRLVGGEPVETKSFTLSDNQAHQFPADTSRQLEPQFYQDLEACTAATFSTHGGTINNTLQLRRGLDVWFCLGNTDSKFGSGQLRHLFLTGCGGTDCFGQNKGDPNTLVSYWLTAKYVDGLQTLCGVDGVSVMGGGTGFHFFQPYNEDQSISESWWRGMIDECDSNAPVTVSYGTTRDEAITILADGRFSKQKSAPNFAAASVWRNL